MTGTLGSLYSHALLIPTKSSKCKTHVVHEQKLKISYVAHARLAQKEECLNFKSEVI